MQRHYEFEELTVLSVIAVGDPGKRTFFLGIGGEEEWLRLWMEKEQLEVLALAIGQVLATLYQKFHPLPKESEEPSITDGVTSGLPSAELEIDQIKVDFDREKATLSFFVHLLGPQKIDEAVVVCPVTLAQLKRLGEEAGSVCAAGRPRCKLCGYPIEPAGHTCPKRN